MIYIQQAYKGKKEIWRFIITTLIVMSPFILNIIFYLLLPEVFEAAIEQNGSMNSNFDLLTSLATFAIFLGLLFILVRFLHQRSVTSLITSRKKTDWKRVFFSFGLWFFISTSMLGLEYFFAPENYQWNFDLYPFIGLVIISLIFMPLQTSFEELLFRGYLMQEIGILVKNKWFPLFFTSILFGLMHSFNPEVEKLGPTVMVFYIGTGVLLAIITLMDEGTELALGFHAANNITAAIFITTNWTVFQTEALLLDTSEPKMNFQVLLPVLIIYPIVILIFSKIYGWTSWKEKLFGKITKPKQENKRFFKEDSMLEL